MKEAERAVTTLETRRLIYFLFRRISLESSLMFE